MKIKRGKYIEIEMGTWIQIEGEPAVFNEERTTYIGSPTDARFKLIKEILDTK